jgi:hypothetical protein
MTSNAKREMRPCGELCRLRRRISRFAFLAAVSIEQLAVADPAQEGRAQLERLDEATSDSDGTNQALLFGVFTSASAQGLRLQVDLVGTRHLRLGVAGLMGSAMDTSGDAATMAGLAYLAATTKLVGPIGARVQAGLGFDNSTSTMTTSLPLHVELGALASIVLSRHTSLVAGPLVEIDSGSTSTLLFGGIELH